jgi:hypothetical protein
VNVQTNGAAPAVLAIVAATSVLVALSEEREAFLELAAKDPRAAMKNSWQGLAKDILRVAMSKWGGAHGKLQFSARHPGGCDFDV